MEIRNSIPATEVMSVAPDVTMTIAEDTLRFIDGVMTYDADIAYHYSKDDLYTLELGVEAIVSLDNGEITVKSLDSRGDERSIYSSNIAGLEVLDGADDHFISQLPADIHPHIAEIFTAANITPSLPAHIVEWI